MEDSDESRTRPYKRRGSERLAGHRVDFTYPLSFCLFPDEHVELCFALWLGVVSLSAAAFFHPVAVIYSCLPANTDRDASYCNIQSQDGLVSLCVCVRPSEAYTK